MGTTISRIEKEFILNSVADNEIPLRLSAYKFRETGRLQSIDDEYLIISGAGDLAGMFPAGSKVRIYFSYYGHVMTFAVRVLSIVEGNLKTDLPEAIHKNLARKYERVPAPHGVEISFEIQETKIELNFPKSEEYDPVEPPEYSDEYDPTNIESLIDSFREKVRQKVSVNTVTMFRGRPPSGLEEVLISNTGKIFYIPSTMGRFPENDYEMGGRIITRAMLLRPEKVSASEEISQDKLPELMAEKQAKGIQAEIYCPIIYHEYVVGFIYLARQQGQEGAFDHELLEETYQFSKMLAYALKMGGYFKDDISDSSSYSCDVIDISASGVLFANNSKKLDQSISLYSDIELFIRFSPRTMRIVGRTMRKLHATSMIYYGIQFMEIKPEDFRFLFDFVYGRSITSEDEELWEGGADPPELNLD